MKKIYLGIILISLIVLSVIFLLFSPVPSSEKILQYNSPQSPVNIIITGDVMLGRGVEKSLNKNLNIFGDLKPIFKHSNLVIVNLESPFHIQAKISKKLSH